MYRNRFVLILPVYFWAYCYLICWIINFWALLHQEGRYGKINKCITFPEMLDMIPFMTGTGDMPPLYMLYGVVVHLDTQNASFSGHYVSYVKDMQGSWFRIDDTEVNLSLLVLRVRQICVDYLHMINGN